MGRITVVGTGWSAGQMTLDVVAALESGAPIILHTDHCGCAEWLRMRNIEFKSLDALYESSEDFDAHAHAAAQAVINAAERQDVVYGVFDVRDRSVLELIAVAGDHMRVIAGPPVEGALLAFALGETRLVEASDWENFHLSAHENCMIRELDNRELACEVKLRLMEVYPETGDICLLNADAAPEQLPLYDLDRMAHYDHRTCVLVPAQTEITSLERYDFGHLNEIMRLLCGPKGCPWDRAQTHQSLRTCMLEEAYEVMDAIDEGDMDHLYDELGDMLLQVAMHAEIGRRHGEFDISDVTTAICAKMIARHTHIFGGDQAGNPDEVIDLWNKNKMAERGQKTRTEVLKSVTRALPALLRAVKVLKRSADVNLCNVNVESTLQCAEKAIHGLHDPQDAEADLGNALLLMCDIARQMKVDPEIALNSAVNRFIDRFEQVERTLLSNGLDFNTAPPEILHEYWFSVKL